ncbi:unnamed protein product [Rotaria sp. Silwood1]|nr:unnamed protein product [Rotaria sp. Silwood1]CAF1405335.1 unnamed protein product [Rotaria sp. Silwood1]CAF1408608.1 unnamed protein product [Rotaria sp. Silwood1]CAF3535447.1 unnamed protein product [Rotaria sp. Silwood1]CAF3569466.1 unnamed protein product [Rotaria sp. Silwood1]
MITVSLSKTIGLFTYKLSTNQQTSQSVNNDYIKDSTNLYISIQVNPLAQIDNNHNNDDDDEELIKLDISPMVASRFCENNSIELRLDQDAEYDNDIANEIKI